MILILKFVFVRSVLGYVFSSDVITAMEKQSKDLVSSVMKRAESVYAKFNTNVIQLIISDLCFL